MHPVLRKLKRGVKEVGHFWDFHITRSVTRDGLEAFARTVRPVQTDRPLIRVGKEGDGGYLVPSDFDDIAACFSPGVGARADFEEAMLARGIPCYLADASVAGPPIEDSRLYFEPLFLGAETRGRYISLDDWIARNAPSSGDIVLQMDIEGAEYEVLAAASDATLRRFRWMVIEVHKLHRILRGHGLRRATEMFARLNELFAVVHLHPNNAAREVGYAGISVPPLIEMTFLRRDRISHSSPVQNFPHSLDVTNVPSMPEIELPEWLTGVPPKR